VVTSSHNESAVEVRCRKSLARSRLRRATARRLRRRRLRLRGAALSIALVALAIAAVGAGAAVGQQAVSSGSGLLALGAQGEAVSAVQRALGIPVTGVFDPKTKVAVVSFQRRQGLLVDGIVGPQTRGALGLAPAPASGAASAATGTASSQSAATGSAGAQSGATGSASAGSTAPSSSLQSIAQCESGGNPEAVGGGGQFRGKYQFTRQSWQAVGGTGDPAAAPEAEQDRRAAMLYAQSGASNWPACGR
jgi:hypothetical protein